MLKNGNSFSPCINFCIHINNVKDTTRSRSNMKKRILSRKNSIFHMEIFKKESKIQLSHLYLITSIEWKKKINLGLKSSEQQYQKNRNNRGTIRLLMMKIMKKDKRKTKINYWKSLLKTWKSKEMKILKIKWLMKISRNLTNNLNLITGNLAKMDVKL